MAFPGSKSRCSNFCALSFLCHHATARAATGRCHPQREMPSEFLLKALTVCSLSILAFPFQLSLPPTFKICPSCPHSNFHHFPYCLQPTLHLPHFICWLTHSLASPVSLYLALCSPQALPLLERLSLSPLQGKPPLLLPPLDNENGAHFLKSALLVQKPCAHG